jgi:hypothetical protein
VRRQIPATRDLHNISGLAMASHLVCECGSSDRARLRLVRLQGGSPPLTVRANQASSAATGNENTTQVRGGDDSVADTAQKNTGAVGSSVRGYTNTDVQGWAYQALNSNQRNTGSQSAQVSGSSACAFGALN